VKIILGAILSAGCAISSVAQGPVAAHVFTINIRVENPVMKAGSDVFIKVQMINTSKQVIDCTMAPSNVTGADRKYQYRVRDGAGNPAKELPIDRKHDGGSIWPCTLEPGRNTPPRDNLISRMYDFTSPGKYFVRVARGDVKSNTITITVTP
jgi:hypothetical protein